MEYALSQRAGKAVGWVDELPQWAALTPVGQVESYWRWRGTSPVPATRQAAGWTFRAAHGGLGQSGLLGATFVPHEFPHLRVVVAATTQVGPRGPGRFRHQRAGLPLEYVGGVLAGALQEPERVGCGTLRFTHAAVDDVDSSWEVFRLLAVGVGRLLGFPGQSALADDLLPRFGGAVPEPPGAG